MARVAVIGAGASGLVAAWRLDARHDVTLYEAEATAGGHATTLDAPRRSGGAAPFDIGFVLLTRAGYPTMVSDLDRLGIDLAEVPDLAVAYQRADGAGWISGGDSPFLRAHRDEMARFTSACLAVVRHPQPFAALSVREFLERGGFDASFGPTCVRPLLSILTVTRETLLETAIVSVADMFRRGVLSFDPIRGFVTVRGGSRRYVDAIRTRLRGRVALGGKVARVERDDDAVVCVLADGAREPHDHVVIGAAPDDALALLAEPTADEADVLGGARFEVVSVVAHTNPAVMPEDRAMWAAFTMIDRADGGAHANYYMPRLQTWVDEDVFVTLDPPPGVIDDDQVVGTRRWRHLIYDRAQMERGRRCAAMQGVRRTWYCGNHVVGPPSHELAWIAGDLVARDLARALPGDS